MKYSRKNKARVHCLCVTVAPAREITFIDDSRIMATHHLAAVTHGEADALATLAGPGEMTTRSHRMSEEQELCARPSYSSLHVMTVGLDGAHRELPQAWAKPAHIPSVRV